MSENGYETIIGMEVHVELNTATKMFCSCPADHFGKAVNSQTCPVCLGLPGALPFPNKAAIRMAQLIGTALGCKLNDFSKFDRKNYFYPDLPKGFQISQYDLPFCSDGELEFEVLGQKRTVVIRRVHLEEDTAKMVHVDGASLVDFNRSGVPLVEIVSEPDLRGSEDVKEYLKALVKRIRYLGVSSCDMEKGTLRLEANISVRKRGEKELPSYKVEVKNVNSFKFIAAAIDFEAERQVQLIENGGSPTQETRGFDENKRMTVGQREKEEAKDYRYFPEPDIPPFRFAKDYLEGIKGKVGELPEEASERLKKLYKFSDHYVSVITASPELLAKFNEVVGKGLSKGVEAMTVANALVNKRVDFQQGVEEIVASLVSNRSGIDKDVDLVAVVEEVIRDNPEAAGDYKKGKKGAVEFLVGQLMKKVAGKADPGVVRRALEEKMRKV